MKPPPWLKWLQELRSEIDKLQQKVKLYEDALEEVSDNNTVGECYSIAMKALAAGKKIGE